MSSAETFSKMASSANNLAESLKSMGAAIREAFPESVQSEMRREEAMIEDVKGLLDAGNLKAAHRRLAKWLYTDK